MEYTSSGEVMVKAPEVPSSSMQYHHQNKLLVLVLHKTQLQVSKVIVM